jgi:hypothetical protein
MAVPFFMLAGELMNAGGMSRRIVNSALVWVGHLQRQDWVMWPCLPPSSWPACLALLSLDTAALAAVF